MLVSGWRFFFISLFLRAFSQFVLLFYELLFGCFCAPSTMFADRNNDVNRARCFPFWCTLSLTTTTTGQHHRQSASMKWLEIDQSNGKHGRASAGASLHPRFGTFAEKKRYHVIHIRNHGISGVASVLNTCNVVHCSAGFFAARELGGCSPPKRAYNYMLRLLQFHCPFSI